LFINSDVLTGRAHYVRLFAVYSVSQKIPPEVFWHFFPNGWDFFTHLLYVPIYARWQIFIQLPATLMKLCHIKRNNPLHIICSMSTIGRNAHIQTFCSRIFRSFPLYFS